jgi:exonuclease SbcD
LTRQQYHQLDLNQIRSYGEQHCSALAIDDSSLSLLHDQEIASLETRERFSPREELVSLVDEWIGAAADEQEKKALVVTREELLLAMDDMKAKY